MADENKGGDVEVKKDAPRTDAFGVDLDKDGKVIPQHAGTKAPEPKFVEVDGKKYVDDGQGKPKLDDKNEPVIFEEKKKEGADDIEKNPAVVALRGEIKTLTDKLEKTEGDKGDMGKNLSAMRTRLEKLEKGDKGTGVEPMFKDIKRVKDLSKDEQEAMTEAEKKLWDENADFKEKINAIVSSSSKKEADAAAAAEAEAEEADATEKFNEKAQAAALKLSGNDSKVANQIIEKFNLFRDNEKLTATQLAERMVEAAKLVPDYKPQKEQKQVSGTAIKDGNENADDPFGVQNIVDTVQKGKRGGYQL